MKSKGNTRLATLQEPRQKPSERFESLVCRKMAYHQWRLGFDRRPKARKLFHLHGSAGLSNLPIIEKEPVWFLTTSKLPAHELNLMI